MKKKFASTVLFVLFKVRLKFQILCPLIYCKRGIVTMYIYFVTIKRNQSQVVCINIAESISQFDTLC